MKNISYMCVLDHDPNMQAVVSKLPPNLQNKWRDQAVKRKKTNRASTTFADLAEFAETASESANDPVFGKEALQRRENIKAERGKGNTRNSSQSKPKGNSFATNLSQPATPRLTHGAWNSNHSSNHPICQFCNRSLDLDDCNQFSKRTADEKRAFLREKQLCFGCYGKHHLSKPCLNKRKCKHCGVRHPTALHIDGFRLVKQEDKNCAAPESGISSVGANLQSSSCNVIKPEEIEITSWLVSAYDFYSQRVNKNSTSELTMK